HPGEREYPCVRATLLTSRFRKLPAKIGLLEPKTENHERLEKHEKTKRKKSATDWTKIDTDCFRVFLFSCLSRLSWFLPYEIFASCIEWILDDDLTFSFVLFVAKLLRDIEEFKPQRTWRGRESQPSSGMAKKCGAKNDRCRRPDREDVFALHFSE